MEVYIDGKFYPKAEAKISVFDHGFLYGDGIFEGIRLYQGCVFRLDEHLERLEMSAKAICLTMPWTRQQIADIVCESCRRNNLTDGYVRALAWRGAGEDMGVAAKRNPIRMAVAVWSWGNYYGDAKMKGAKLDIAKWKRPSPETIPHAAKAAGLYMICTMSKHAAEAKGCSDAMMFDYRGYVAEATGANIFFVKDGEVHTPKPDAFLNGITRQTVIGMLREKGITVHERVIMPAELEDFQQCWLTGTAAEVTPVGQIGDYNFEVGALTQQISADYEKLVRA